LAGLEVHFDAIGRNIDIYTHEDVEKLETVDFAYPLLDSRDFYFTKAKSEYSVTAIMPEYVKVSGMEKIVVTDENELCNTIKTVCTNIFKTLASENPKVEIHKQNLAKMEGYLRELETIF
jgi:hypothetical protein